MKENQDNNLNYFSFLPIIFLIVSENIEKKKYYHVYHSIGKAAEKGLFEIIPMTSAKRKIVFCFIKSTSCFKQ